MSSIRWRGGAAPVAQVLTFAFGGTFEATDINRVTIGSKHYDFVAGSTTTATVVSNLVTAWNALSATVYPEFAEMTASANTTTLTLTMDEAGVPAVVTITPLEANLSAADSQTIEGAGTATTGTIATAATGPWHWDQADNWVGGVAPTGGDDVYLEHSDDDIKYGLANSGTTYASVRVAASFTGTIGLPDLNDDATPYPEYRQQALAAGMTVLDVGLGDEGDGSGRLRFEGGTVQSTVTVRLTASSLDTDQKAMFWKGTHASNVVNVYRGSLAIGQRSTDSATVATLRVGSDGGANDVELYCGPGCTLTTITQLGGQMEINSAFTTLNKYGGSAVIKGSGAVTTLLNDQGGVDYLSSGTLTNLTVSAGGSIDFSRDLRAKTVTNCTLHAGATLLDPAKVATFSNGIVLTRCGITDVALDLGQGRTITPS